MAYLESKLRSSDFPYSAMQNMYDANRNADLERQMMMMQLAREKEKMRQEKMRTNKLSLEDSRGIGKKDRSELQYDPGYVPDVFRRSAMGMSTPADTYEAIGHAAIQNQATGGAAQPIRNMISGNMQSMMNNAAQVNAAANARGGAPMEPDVMSPEYQQQLLANRMAQQGLEGYMGERGAAEAAQQLAEEKAQGYIGSARERSTGQIGEALVDAIGGGGADANKQAAVVQKRIQQLTDQARRRAMDIQNRVMELRGMRPEKPEFMPTVQNWITQDSQLAAIKQEIEALKKQLGGLGG